MNRKSMTYLFSSPQQWYSRILCSCIIAFFYAAGSFVLSTPVQAEGVPGGNITNPVVSAVDIAKPAVVRIITTIDGRLTVTFPDGSSANFPTDGGSYPLSYSGSGAFISSHGDILTADHVVRPPQDADLDDYLYQAASQDVADYVNRHFNVSTPYTRDDAYFALSSNYFRSQGHYGDPKSTVYLSTEYTGPLSTISLKNMPQGTYATVSQIEKESAVDQKDVAIVHVNMDDTASIPLGDSSNVEPQDELTVIGFPGNGDISKRRDPSVMLTPSIKKLFVNAVKKTDEGAQVIQVTGGIEHGDSGGPVLNNNGEIVGVVSQSAGVSDPIASIFLQASSSAQELIQNLSLDTTPGKFQKAWRQAFKDYTSTKAGHWHSANKAFQQLVTDYPSFNAGTAFVDYTKTMADHEVLPKPAQPQQPKGGSIGTIIATVVGVLVLLLIAALIISRRRKNRKMQLAGLPATPGYNGMGVYPSVSTTNSFPPVTPPATPGASAYWQTPSAQTTPGAFSQTTGVQQQTAGNGSATVSNAAWSSPWQQPQTQDAQSGFSWQQPQPQTQDAQAGQVASGFSWQQPQPQNNLAGQSTSGMPWQQQNQDHLSGLATAGVSRQQPQPQNQAGGSGQASSGASWEQSTQRATASDNVQESKQEQVPQPQSTPAASAWEQTVASARNPIADATTPSAASWSTQEKTIVSQGSTPQTMQAQDATVRKEVLAGAERNAPEATLLRPQMPTPAIPYAGGNYHRPAPSQAAESWNFTPPYPIPTPTPSAAPANPEKSSRPDAPQFDFEARKPEGPASER